MITRFAIFEGDIPREQRDDFRLAVVTRLLPAIRRFPGIGQVAASFSFQRDEGAPPILMVLTTTYGDRQTLEKALAGPEREQAKAVTAQIFTQFAECRIHHHVTETHSLPAES